MKNVLEIIAGGAAGLVVFVGGILFLYYVRGNKDEL